MARSFLAGKLPFAVRGGYDFVDVRDVANGILACSESGEPGKGYILSGHYVTIRRMLQIIGAAAKRRYRPICLPLGLARLAAPYYERRSLKDRKPLFFTPYSISVLASNGCFSHAAASKCFAYQPRPLEQTLRDMAAWLIAQKEAGKALPHLIRAPHDQRRPLLSCSVFRPSAAHPGYFSGCAAFYRSACPLAFLPRFVYTEIVLFFYRYGGASA